MGPRRLPLPGGWGAGPRQLHPCAGPTFADGSLGLSLVGPTSGVSPAGLADGLEVGGSGERGSQGIVESPGQGVALAMDFLHFVSPQ